jgi:hypothetical protein
LPPSTLAADSPSSSIRPATLSIYLIKQADPPTIDDQYVREKLAEAEEDIRRGNYSEWNVDELKRELLERLAAKQARK